MSDISTENAVLDSGGKRNSVDLPFKPGVGIAFNFTWVAQLKINLLNRVSDPEAATPLARVDPQAAITPRVTGTSDTYALCTSPLPSYPLTELPANRVPQFFRCQGERKWK